MSLGYQEIFARNLLLLGREAVERLRASRVIVCGLGGVGSYVVEALARSGVGALTLVDFDMVKPSNLNRQLPALLSTLEQAKTEVVGARVAEINPACRVSMWRRAVTPDNVTELGQADYLVDAVDDLAAKVALICYAKAQGIPVASAMGAGLRLAPERLRLADLSQTEGCPLARRLRKELRRRGIERGVNVVYSEEAPRTLFPADAPPEPEAHKSPLGSSAFVPAAAGLFLASLVVRELAGIEIER